MPVFILSLSAGINLIDFVYNVFTIQGRFGEVLDNKNFCLFSWAPVKLLSR